MDDLTIIPAPENAEGFVGLARTASGKVFRKHMISLGTLIHPQTGQRLKLDEQWYDRLKQNFDAKVCPIVQVPLADDQNRHSEAPDRNVGEVIGIEREGNKVYAVMDIRDEDAAKKVGKTLLGSSAFLHMDYTDTSTGKKVGPTLLHNCITNRPYVTTLDDYEPVLAASNVIDGEPAVMVLSTDQEPASAPDPAPSADSSRDVPDQGKEETEVPLSKEELLAKLKAEHGIDVEALQASAAAPPAETDTVALSTALVSALTQAGVVKLSGNESQIDTGTLTEAVVELAHTTKAQGEEIGSLKLSAAEREVDGYIGAGRAYPKARATLVKLALTDRDAMESLLSPENEPLVKLSSPSGVTGDEGQHRQETDIDTELAKLSAQHPEFFDGGKK